MPGRVLVTGGAGYIGRCTAYGLQEAGYEPVIVDNFSTSQEQNSKGVETHHVELSDLSQTKQAFEKIGNGISGIIHFAALALVGESWEKPERYYRNNLLSTLNVLECAAELGPTSLVFSSSCTVYGVPKLPPMSEETPVCPISPYGDTKVIGETMLKRFCKARNLKGIALRYFNPAGAYGGFGEKHDPETHLIPNVVSAALSGKSMSIFGTDYDTHDGTCIRDFIHIEDLVGAHIKALDFLGGEKGSSYSCFNIGTGRGTSVKEVISTAEKVLNKKIHTDSRPRRPGDPPVLVAAVEKAKSELGWEAKKDVAAMIGDHHKFIA